nr:MAG TPA: putative periplasmic lipoprotein [Caudoviricetes sp.]
MMMKVMNKLKGSDKLLHSKYGNMIFISIFLVAVLFLSVGKSLLITAIALGAIGLCKELYDKYYKGTFIDWWDIVASFVPYPVIKHINR